VGGVQESTGVGEMLRGEGVVREPANANRTQGPSTSFGLRLTALGMTGLILVADIAVDPTARARTPSRQPAARRRYLRASTRVHSG
jgi:hypothetical protein